MFCLFYDFHMLLDSFFNIHLSTPFVVLEKPLCRWRRVKHCHDVRGDHNWRQTILSLWSRWAAMWDELSLSKYLTKYQEKLSSLWKMCLWTNLFCQILTEWLKIYMANMQAPLVKTLRQAQLLRLFNSFLWNNIETDTFFVCSMSKHIMFKQWKCAKVVKDAINNQYWQRMIRSRFRLDNPRLLSVFLSSQWAKEVKRMVASDISLEDN